MLPPLLFISSQYSLKITAFEMTTTWKFNSFQRHFSKTELWKHLRN